jgi:hypothetical protein
MKVTHLIWDRRYDKADLQRMKLKSMQDRAERERAMIEEDRAQIEETTMNRILEMEHGSEEDEEEDDEISE